jgi:ACS family hexuronate transporter-like MFS transporter
MKLPGVRWIIAGFIFAETMLAYVDLQVLSVLAPLLSEKLKITNTQYALITQAFLVGMTISFLLGGSLIDRLGVRWGLALSLAWWSVADILHIFATTPMGLATCRFLLALGYPGAFMAAARAISEWYPPQERGIVYGLSTAGATVGAVVSYPTVVWITSHYGWQAAFVYTGVAGLFFVVGWLLVYYSPAQHPWASKEELAYVEAGTGTPVVSLAAPTGLLRDRTFWAVAVGRFVGDNPWVFYAFWLPKFLAEHGLSLAEIGRIGWIPYVFADLGSVGGGWLSGKLIQRGFSPQRARVSLLTLGLPVLSFVFVLGSIRSELALIALLSLFMMFTTSWLINLNVIVVDTFPPRMIATTTGMTTCAGTFGGVFFTYAVGRIVQSYSYRPVFFVMALLSLSAYVLVRRILPKR